MKYILIFPSIVVLIITILFYSLISETPVKYKVSIIYTNGSREVVCFTKKNKDDNIGMNNSCLYKNVKYLNDVYYFNPIRCGVRSFNIISIKE